MLLLWAVLALALLIVLFRSFASQMDHYRVSLEPAILGVCTDALPSCILTGRKSRRGLIHGNCG